MKFLLTAFIVLSIIHLLLAYHLPSFIPHGHFPYDDLIRKNFGVYPLTFFANFDGYQYLSIAGQGYHQLQQSYFPLFPILVFLVSTIFSKNYVLSGIVVSWTCYLLGLIYFKKYIDELLKDKIQTRWAIVFLVTFPTAFFYQVIYPESLFLFLSAASLYYLSRKKYLPATVFVFFASLTKIQGMLLIIPFFLTVFEAHWLQLRNLSLLKTQAFSLRMYRQVFVTLSPVYGLLVFSGYLYFNYKDPLYFYHAQSAFGANRATDKLVLVPQVLYRYIKIFYFAQTNLIYWIAWLEFLIFLLVTGVLLFDLFLLMKREEKNTPQISLDLYSLAAILLPSLTGTLTSLPRYALISFGLFTALSKIKSTTIKVLIVVTFLTLQILLFIYFLKGYFVS